MLTNSRASEFIKDILTYKAKARPGRRFFGEAYIVTQIGMKAGWYSSFKWLTADRWVSGRGLKNKFERDFYHALMEYIGSDSIKKLQEKALSFFNKHREQFKVGKTYKKPVAPDLWIIDQKGRFRFIESKLPDDRIGHAQIAGMNLIKEHLKVPAPVSVSIMQLHPEDTDPV